MLFWTSEATTPAGVREELLAASYRALYIQRFGPSKTLRQMMRQEGLAQAFAGVRSRGLEPDELTYTREVLAPHLGTEAFPVAFACLYGDRAARWAGYPPLGLSEGAGYALALDDARRRAGLPEAVLLGAGI